mgnify:CR=1 FL=1
MQMRKAIALVVALALLAGLLVIGCAKKGEKAPPAPGKGITLSVTWFQWQPAGLLTKVAEDFTKETGIVVKGDYVPYEQYHARLFTEMHSKGSSWDLIVVDSQWVGEMVILSLIHISEPTRPY